MILKFTSLITFSSKFYICPYLIYPLSCFKDILKYMHSTEFMILSGLIGCSPNVNKWHNPYIQKTKESLQSPSPLGA